MYSPIKAYRLFFARFLSFEGRSTRSEYWWNFIPLVMIQFFFFFVNMMVADYESRTHDYSTAQVLYWGLYVIDMFIFLNILSLHVRRLHDINKSGWWTLINLTIVGFLVSFIFAMFKTKHNHNKYGADPTLEPEAFYNYYVNRQYKAYGPFGCPLAVQNGFGPKSYFAYDQSNAAFSQDRANKYLQSEYHSSLSFFKALKLLCYRFFSFDGRASRSEFWWGMLIILPIYIVTMVFLASPSNAKDIDSQQAMLILSVIALSIFNGIGFASLSIRRFNDLNLNLWAILLMAVPFGFIVILGLALRNSEPGINKYGFDPTVDPDDFFAYHNNKLHKEQGPYGCPWTFQNGFDPNATYAQNQTAQDNQTATAQEVNQFEMDSAIVPVPTVDLTKRP